jgi:hypothetical protein
MDQFYLHSIGTGGYLSTDLEIYHDWVFGMRAFVGNNFFSYDGSPLYSSLREDKNLQRTEIDYQGLKFGRKLDIGPNTQGVAFLNLHRIQSSIEWSLDINLRMLWETTLIHNPPPTNP